MIPAAFLLIILIVLDLASHIALWMRATHQTERVEDIVRDAMQREIGAVVKISDYERKNSDQDYQIRRLLAWSKVPDEYKAP